MNLFTTIASSTEAIRKATVEVRVERTPSRTVYHLTGEDKAVKCKVESLYREYPSSGYGTFATYTGNKAIVTRANSCD